MKDVMLDLETLGTRYSAAIISIGACYFDRATGNIGREFSANIDGAMMDRFTVDYGTIEWWFRQSNEARLLSTQNPRPLQGVLAEFAQFFLAPDVFVWSHATFDIPILMNAFEVAGIPCPVPFRNMRDLRTLMDIAGPSASMVRNGVHHHALDDAKYQALYASEAFQRINGAA